MTISYITIAFVSLVVIGLMELVKNYLPSNTSSKVSSAISLGLALAVSISFGILKGDGITSTVVNTVAVVGLTQTSYNFVLKLLKAAIEKLKSNITKATSLANTANEEK